MIDYRVSKQTVKPGDGTLLFANFTAPFDPAKKSRLQNILCHRSRTDTLLQKANEFFAPGKKRCERFASDFIWELFHHLCAAK
jgi:hypothetical protein